MSSPFVLDGSTTVSWCFEELQTPYAVAILQRLAAGAEVHVPHVWPLEVSNALLKAQGRRHITREEFCQYIEQLAALHVRVDLEGAARAFTDVIMLAERYQLSTYDASYLELAHRLGVALATGDKNLIQAARALRVSVLQL